jgi:hypothetical protein
MRLLRVVLPATILSTLISGSALAVPPDRFPSPSTDFTYPAGLTCSFPVSVQILQDNGFLTFHYDQAGNVRWFATHGVLKVRVTNDNSEESVTLNISGAGKTVPNPDGSSTLTGTGHWTLAFFPTDNPPNSLLYVSGRFTISVSPTGDFTLLERTGTVVDLCDALG